MILEGTDGKIHFILHTAEMESLRAQGHFAQNAFVCFTRKGDFVTIEDFGDAHAYLSSGHLREASKRLIERGVSPAESEHSGWLGLYHTALANPPRIEPIAGPNRAARLGKEKPRNGERGR